MATLLVVGVVGFVGWKVYNKSTQKDTATPTTSSDLKETPKQPATQNTQEIKADTRKDYTSKQLSLTLKIPDGWTATETNDGGGLIAIKSADYAETTNGIGASVPTKGALINVTTSPSGNLPVEETDVVKTQVGYGGGKFTRIKVGDKQALEYIWSYESSPVTTTSFILGNKVVSVTYSSPDNSHTSDVYKEYKNILDTIN